MFCKYLMFIIVWFRKNTTLCSRYSMYDPPTHTHTHIFLLAPVECHISNFSPRQWGNVIKLFAMWLHSRIKVQHASEHALLLNCLCRHLWLKPHCKPQLEASTMTDFYFNFRNNVLGMLFSVQTSAALSNVAACTWITDLCLFFRLC